MSLDENISRSGTLPPEYYFDPDVWERCKEKVFMRSWLWSGDVNLAFEAGNNISPFLLVKDYLEEPLMLVKDGKHIRCLSNVCTHRAFILAHDACRASKITCGYHGRRFSLRGKFLSMPEFEEAEDFPRPCDDLTSLPVGSWKDFIFTSLDPAVELNIITERLDERLSFLDWQRFRHAPEYSTTYEVKAHWALYVENYLEGFHIPFVHNTLNSMLDYGSYRTDCHDHVVLQTGYSDKRSDSCFDLPPGHPDHGTKVTGYYYWCFPNLMLNFYPWGLQVNIVRPVSIGRCRIDFEYYICDEAIWSKMDGEQIAEVTQVEDEFVVEGVQKGLGSRLYPGGRFSPKREKGVHYFQKLFKQYMDS